MTQSQKAAETVYLIERENIQLPSPGAKEYLGSGARWEAIRYGSVCARTGASPRMVARTHQMKKTRPDLVEKMHTGEITYAEASRQAGYKESDFRAGKTFGKGDKWDEVIVPLTRYLRGQKSRKFLYTNVNYREAQRRLKLIDEIVPMLLEARKDLESRSERASLRTR